MEEALGHDSNAPLRLLAPKVLIRLEVASGAEHPRTLLAEPIPSSIPYPESPSTCGPALLIRFNRRPRYHRIDLLSAGMPLLRFFVHFLQ